MKRDLWTHAALGVLGATAVLTSSWAASAAPCNLEPTPIYITGSSAVKPFVVALGKELAAANPAVTVVYQGAGSCNGPDAIINATKMTGTASHWDAAGMEITCELDLAGTTADVGVSDVFATSCPGFASLPADVGDFFGPIQVMNFVVPVASSQVSISAEGAYFVYGFGAEGQVDPWSDNAFLFHRPPTSGTQQMIAKAIKVPANVWKGTEQPKSGDVLTAVAGSTNPEGTIGILSSDVADANRDKVKILAYQHFKQSCAYWPDTNGSSFDKISVREGTYPIWGPLHMFAKVDGTQKPTNPDAAKFIGYFTGTVPTPPNVNLMDLEIGAHTIPDCAMKVRRTTEIGDVMPYTPSEPCGCYFEFKANGRTKCDVCTKDSECTGSAKHCRFGYCEAN